MKKSINSFLTLVHFLGAPASTTRNLFPTALPSISNFPVFNSSSHLQTNCTQLLTITLFFFHVRKQFSCCHCSIPTLIAWWFCPFAFFCIPNIGRLFGFKFPFVGNSCFSHFFLKCERELLLVLFILHRT